MPTNEGATQNESMRIRVEQLRRLDDLLACEKLQSSILGRGSRSTLNLPALTSVLHTGGLILGVRDPVRNDELIGALVDFSGRFEEYRGHLTAFLGVAKAHRGRGIAKALRAEQRTLCLRERVDVVFWWADPLRSACAHLDLNRLGAIATAHVPHALGTVNDHLDAGLPTDRIQLEWWLEAPRTQAIESRQSSQPAVNVGLDKMQVLTRTSARPDGLRAPIGLEDQELPSHVMIEIPVDMDRLRQEAPEDAASWRLLNRSAYELCFGHGYTMVGLLHQGSRSFQLLERADRGKILGRTT